MNLADVIEVLIEERNVDKEQVIEVVREGITLAYERKFPDITFKVEYNAKAGTLDVFAEKEAVSSVTDHDVEISLRKARVYKPDAVAGDPVHEPFTETVGRIEMMVAKQYIAGRMRELEQKVVYDEFKPKEGTIVNGMVNKRERAGFVIKMGDSMAFLPMSCTIPEEALRVGYPIRALLKEVLEQSRGDHQLVLDRASPEFVRKLLELEIPEVFEGVVEIKNVVRSPGYKSKVVVSSNSAEIDPVGTCVGVGGVRIKPILKELGREKIDLIEHTESLEELVATALKPAEIDKVAVNEAEGTATVWLPQDQRSFAIGKQGQNITLVSRLTGLDVQLQEDAVEKGALAALEAAQQEHAAEAASNSEELAPADESIELPASPSAEGVDELAGGDDAAPEQTTTPDDQDASGDEE